MQYWSELEQGSSVPSLLSASCVGVRSLNLHLAESSVPIPDSAPQ